MKVLHISPFPTPHDARFLRSMQNAGEEPVYMALDSTRSLTTNWPENVEQIRWEGLPCDQHLDPAALLKVQPAFERALQDLKPDVAQAGPACSAGFLMAISRCCPFVAMLWGHDILWDAAHDTVLRAMAAHTLRRANFVLCDCDTVRREAQRLADVANSRVIQMPWGIQLKYYSPAPAPASLRDELGWQEHPVVISARGWAEVYGIDILLEGFRSAHRLNPRLRLILLGDGPLRPMVASFIKENDLQYAVHLQGRVADSEMPRFLQCGDIYVSCASTDGASITLLEALALELPAIVTDIPSNREWVDPTCGWLFPDRDSCTLAKEIISALDLLPADLKKMGCIGSQKVFSRADFDSNVHLLIKAHHALIGSRCSSNERDGMPLNTASMD